MANITVKDALGVNQVVDSSTEAKQTLQLTELQSILAKLTADPATQTTLASILAKLIANPATDTLQGTGNTTLASILAKIIVSPATEVKQDTLIAKDFATQTTLESLLTELQLKADLSETQPVNVQNNITGFATQTTLASILAKLTSSTATLSNVASSATNITLLALNANRVGFKIYNDSTAILYVKFGTTSSPTSFTVKLFPEDFYEDGLYTGVINGIWSSATGTARITELTA